MRIRLISLALVITLIFLSLVPAVHAEDWDEHEIYEIGEIRHFAHLVICDIDGANFSDVVVASYAENCTYWYECPANPATEPWTNYTIGSGLLGARDVFVYDMDGDTDLDVVVTSWFDNKVVWYEHPDDPKTEPWNNYTICSNLNMAGGVFVYDIDSDTHPDVVASGFLSDTVVWCEAPDNPKTNWPSENKHTISSTINGPLGVYVYDMDGDGDPDVVAAAEVGNYTVWYECPADPKTGTWNTYTIGSNLNGSVDVGVAYIDSDLNPDVVVTAHEADKVVWYKAPDDPKTTWPQNAEHIIASGLDDARGLKIANIDGWSTLDVVVAASGNSTTWTGGKVVWYQGPEDPTDPEATWTPTTIAELRGAYDVDVGNIDGDAYGSPDVVASGGFHYGWPSRLVLYASNWPLWPIPEVPFGTVLLLGTSLLVPVAIASARRLRLNRHVRR